MFLVSESKHNCLSSNIFNTESAHSFWIRQGCFLNHLVTSSWRLVSEPDHISFWVQPSDRMKFLNPDDFLNQIEICSHRYDWRNRMEQNLCPKWSLVSLVRYVFRRPGGCPSVSLHGRPKCAQAWRQSLWRRRLSSQWRRYRDAVNVSPNPWWFFF